MDAEEVLAGNGDCFIEALFVSFAQRRCKFQHFTVSGNGTCWGVKFGIIIIRIHFGFNRILFEKKEEENFEIEIRTNFAFRWLLSGLSSLRYSGWCIYPFALIRWGLAIKIWLRRFAKMMKGLNGMVVKMLSVLYSSKVNVVSFFLIFITF